MEVFPGDLGHTGAFFRGWPIPIPVLPTAPAGTGALTHCGTDISVPI